MSDLRKHLKENSQGFARIRVVKSDADLEEERHYYGCSQARTSSCLIQGVQCSNRSWQRGTLYSREWKKPSRLDFLHPLKTCTRMPGGSEESLRP